MNEFLNCAKEPSLKIPIEDCKHLHRVNINVTGVSAFYCMPKVHKNETATPLRLVTITTITKLH